MLFALPLLTMAQRKEQMERRGYSGNSKSPGEEYTHDGFYLSMAIGSFFSHVTDAASVASSPPQHADLVFDGSGAELDIKIGGTIAPNLILHGTLVSSVMENPKVTRNGKAVKMNDNFAIGESLVGIGVTYYLMPSNFFGSATLGLGRFTIIDGNNGGTTDRGFGMQMKVGKEWWVGRNWGLGVGLTYGKSVVTSVDGMYTDKFDSNHFGILFNATFN